MADDINTLMDYWIYGIERRLRGQLELVWPEPDSDEEPIFIPEDEAYQIRSWLNLPPEPKSREERQRDLARDFKNHGYSDAEALRKAALESHSTGRAQGRPKVLGPYAIRALTMHLTTPKTWREIVEEIKGPCEHVCPSCGDVVRPALEMPSGLKPRSPRKRCARCKLTIRLPDRREVVCYKCVDAMRSAVGELEKFLRSKGLHPNLPRRDDLDKLSPEELEKAWPRPDSQ